MQFTFYLYFHNHYSMSKLRAEKIAQTADQIIDENLEAFMELAK